MRAGRQADEIFRYFVITALRDVGLYDYLQEPRSFGEILGRFAFEDSPYVRDILRIQLHDKKQPLRQNSEAYVFNRGFEYPDLSQIMGRTDPRIRPMSLMAGAMSTNIIDRMRAKKLGLRQVFEKDEYKVVNMFNELLERGPYTAIRKACFAYLTKADRRWLIGKHLIDIGCGNGQETAEIWLHMEGKTRITAVDAVPGMLELAQDQFAGILEKLDPDHPPLTDENRPVYKLANAVELPFEDNSFDSAFYSIMLHWTSDPAKAIQEMVRVIRPGGLIFGAQSYKPLINPYLDLVIRSSRNSYGAFWKEEYLQWFKDCGQQVEMVTPAGVVRVRVKKNEASKKMWDES